MTLGTPDGLVSAYGDHQSVRRGFVLKRPKLTTAEEKWAYTVAHKRDGGTGRNRGICQKCRAFGVVQMDHRQGRLPGNTVPSNLQALCPADHQWKTDNPEDAVAEGYAVLRHTIMAPSEWPAHRWVVDPDGTDRLAWVLYLDAPENDQWWREIADIEAYYLRQLAGVL